MSKNKENARNKAKKTARSSSKASARSNARNEARNENCREFLDMRMRMITIIFLYFFIL